LATRPLADLMIGGALGDLESAKGGRLAGGFKAKRGGMKSSTGKRLKRLETRA
jgi:hypothetical protein